MEGRHTVENFTSRSYITAQLEKGIRLLEVDRFPLHLPLVLRSPTPRKTSVGPRSEGVIDM
eukprot:1302372-Amorphochlora_amoeboformis.AAC.1